MRKKSTFFSILLLGTSGFLFTPALNGISFSLDSLLETIPPEALQILKEKGEVHRYDRSNSGLILSPKNDRVKTLQNQDKQMDPDAMVEGLYLIPYTQDVNDINLKLYNILRDVGAISRIVYMSYRRKAVVPLFNNVYTVENLKTRKRIEIKPLNNIPSSSSIYVHMKEVNLGNAYYRVEYLYNGQSLSFQLTNATPLRVFFKIVDTDGMRIKLLLFPVEEGFLVYGYCGVQFVNSRFVFKMMDPFTGFYRRLYAVKTWISNELHGTNLSPNFPKPFLFTK